MENGNCQCRYKKHVFYVTPYVWHARLRPVSISVTRTHGKDLCEA